MSTAIAARGDAIEPGARPQTAWWLAVAAVLYVLALLLTRAPFAGDSAVYVDDAVKVRTGVLPPQALWEFGHALWRPLAYLLTPLAEALVPSSIAWTPGLKVMAALYAVSELCGLVVMLLMADLLRRLARHWAAVLVPVLILVWGSSFLSYSQTATPYIVSLALLVVAVWCSITGPGSGLVRAVVTGTALGLSALFWFPFVLAFPAGAAAPLFCRRDALATRVRDVMLALALAGLLLAAGLLAASLAAGCRSVSDFLAWFAASSHGWKQNRRLVRAVSGCARLLIDLGPTGVLLKRFTFKDPYNPVSLGQLARQVLWQIGLFWALIGAAVIAAARSRALYVAALFALAAGPMFFFAVALFEPSSPERFLPVLPFLLFAFAAAWTADRQSTLERALQVLIVAFALLLPVMNGPTMLRGVSADPAVERLLDFRRSAGVDDTLYTVVRPDTQLTLSPFHEVNRPTPVSVVPLLEVASASVREWRRNFARYVLERWSKGSDVWVVKGAFSDRPDASLAWVEGDAAGVHWRDIPSFLRTLEYDRESARADGARRVSRSAATRTILERTVQ
jgi:hypothetical protein